MRWALLLLAAASAFGQNEQDIAEGKALFRSNCAFCHGLTGGGGRGPSLASGRLLHGSTATEIKNVIHDGVPGTTMPAFTQFEPAELDALATFVRTLSSTQAGTST